MHRTQKAPNPVPRQGVPGHGFLFGEGNQTLKSGPSRARSSPSKQARSGGEARALPGPRVPAARVEPQSPFYPFSIPAQAPRSSVILPAGRPTLPPDEGRSFTAPTPGPASSSPPGKTRCARPAPLRARPRPESRPPDAPPGQMPYPSSSSAPRPLPRLESPCSA